MKFRLNTIPPSYDKHFKIDFHTHQIYLTKEAKDFKKTVFLTTPNMNIREDSLFKIKIDIHNNWYYKNKGLKKQDVQNMDKLLIDALFQKLGIDDSRLMYISINKIQDTTQYTEIELEEVFHNA